MGQAFPGNLHGFRCLTRDCACHPLRGTQVNPRASDGAATFRVQVG
jgi:hypothetical protein